MTAATSSAFTWKMGMGSRFAREVSSFEFVEEFADLHLRGFQGGGQHLNCKMGLGMLAAGVDIDGGVVALGPSVNGDVGLGQAQQTAGGDREPRAEGAGDAA